MLWGIEEIKEVHPRRYNSVHSSVEFFLNRGKVYFFNLYSVKNQKRIITFIQQHYKSIFTYLNPIEAFKRGNFTDKWKQGKMTNFEYLMKLNTYAGRSFNDVNQYPVFPWILADYTSPSLDLEPNELNEKQIFRNLSRPIGAQTP